MINKYKTFISILTEKRCKLSLEDCGSKHGTGKIELSIVIKFDVFICESCGCTCHVGKYRYTSDKKNGKQSRRFLCCNCNNMKYRECYLCNDR